MQRLPLSSRLKVSSGNRTATPDEVRIFGYDSCARVHRLPWRDATEEQAANVSGQGIAVLAFPQLPISKLASLGLLQVADQPAANAFCQRADVRAVLGELIDVAVSLHANSPDLQPQGISVREPGLLTTTVDPVQR